MNIRTAQHKDLKDIVEIYNQAILQKNATADLTPLSIDDKRQWFEEHTQDKYPIWVYCDESDHVLGWCSLSPYRRGRMALRFTAEISYYIHKYHRKKSIGSKLLQYAIDHCEGLEIKSIFGILLDINIPSIKILEKFGFKKWAHLPGIAEINGKECGHVYYGIRIYN
ncbi:MAG TPA: N-acetyltransferase family protein [Victivallales bacterium]|nr:N-acetyltransferase family protein [Victivallales bacterium]